MSESAGEKTQAPTPKRKEKALEQGDLLKSRDFGAALIILLGCGWMVLMGPQLLGACKEVMAASFSFGRADIESFQPWKPLATAGWKLAPSLGALPQALPPLLRPIPAPLGRVLLRLGRGERRGAQRLGGEADRVAGDLVHEQADPRGREQAEDRERGDCEAGAVHGQPSVDGAGLGEGKGSVTSAHSPRGSRFRSSTPPAQRRASAATIASPRPVPG